MGAQLAALQGWGSPRRGKKVAAGAAPLPSGWTARCRTPTLSKQVLFLRNQTLCIQVPGAHFLH